MSRHPCTDPCCVWWEIWHWNPKVDAAEKREVQMRHQGRAYYLRHRTEILAKLKERRRVSA